MNTKLASAFLRTAALAATFAVLPRLTATESTTSDLATRLLSKHGLVSIQAVGPYVERGTYRIQVSTKLGRPDSTLSDNIWLYENRAIDGSNARGTLVVRFENGRVTELSIATPKTVAALRENAGRNAAGAMLASR